MTERRLSSRTMFQGKRFSIEEIEVELAPGTVVRWEIVDKRGHSVAVVPVDDQRRVYLVEEYFGATDERGLSLPKGMIEPGETAVEAAQREMREEIGLAGHLTMLVEVTVSPGYLTQRTTLFLARDLFHDPLVGDDEGNLESVRLPLDEAVDMALAGKIAEARTVAGLLMAQKMLDRRA